MVILTEKDQARFWSKVTLPNEQGCMLWLSPPLSTGYGQFWLKGRKVTAHRVSYFLAYGGIPAGLHIDHVKARGCRHRHCVAPAHLEAVTMAENNRRSESAPAKNARKTHCKRGHVFDGPNTFIDPRGGRHCRACQALHQRAYRARKRNT